MARSAATKFLYDWDWDGAEQEYRRSINLNPGAVDVRTPFAQLLASRGRFDEALKISEETIRARSPVRSGVPEPRHFALLQEGLHGSAESR